MTIKIDHLKYRVSTKPTSQGTEFVELNLVFSVSQDDVFYSAFKSKTEDYVERHLLKQPPQNPPFQSVTGYEFQNPILKYLPKFDKFQFHEYFGWYGLVQGAINDLRDLQLGINKSRTTDSCLLCHILEALEYHWD